MIVDVHLEAITGRRAFLKGKTAPEIRRFAQQCEQIAEELRNVNESEDTNAYVDASIRASKKLNALADAFNGEAERLQQIYENYVRAQEKAIQRALLL